MPCSKLNLRKAKFKKHTTSYKQSFRRIGLRPLTSSLRSELQKEGYVYKYGYYEDKKTGKKEIVVICGKRIVPENIRGIARRFASRHHVKVSFAESVAGYEYLL